VEADGIVSEAPLAQRAVEARSTSVVEPTATPVAAPADARRGRVVLFTAFEPSGDAHAAPVIAALKERDPDLLIYAWGGPKMADAGAQVVEMTAGDGAMGLVGLAKILKVRRHILAIRDWSQQQRVVVHVPVDSPAANFPICKFLKPRGVRVAHLVAPQMWAWGGWRVNKLRRLTDVVMCLLPFEEQWYRSRHVPAKFIGHPVINRELDTADLAKREKHLTQGSPRILLLPGSRSGEVKANLRLMVATFVELADRNRGCAGLIVAANAELAKLCRKLIPDMPTGLHIVINDDSMLDAAIHWCDLVLAVSGTVSLDIARQQRAMIGIYRVGLISWLGAKIVLKTPFRLLPNVIAGRRIVPEFVPCAPWMGPRVLVDEATRFLKDSRNVAIAAEELRRVVLRFHGHNPDVEAADIVMRLIESRPIEDAKPAPPPTEDPV